MNSFSKRNNDNHMNSHPYRFTVTSRDVLGRIGKLETKSGVIETPHLLPVINLLDQPVTPREILQEMHCNALITNAYLTIKNFRERAVEEGIHTLLDFKGVVATDSGAYQILEYGRVDVTPIEIAQFQEEIDTDIAVILDIPTGIEKDRRRAEQTVDETVRRADETLKAVRRNDILWVGPIQGGLHLDLVAKSAREMAKRPFAIYALGSPTRVMEQYMFDRLLDMILTAKMNLPPDRPLHLFGAGHPFMFALAAAVGCDLFDSAAYALYAKTGRYLTASGTSRLEDLEYFPCSCPVCVKYKPEEVKAAEPTVRTRLLALHNLYTCMEEERRVKQAIRDGRLWELMELRAHSHPSLLQALRKLKLYERFIEEHSPSRKKRGIFHLTPYGLSRPEVVRHRRKLLEDYRPPRGARVLLLLPEPSGRPYHASRELKEALTLTQISKKVHTCVYASPFSIIPLELDETYPLSQTETAHPPDLETAKNTAETVAEYIARQPYKTVILHLESETWGRMLEKSCRESCKRTGKRLFVSFRGGNVWSREALQKTSRKVRKVLAES